MMPLVGTLSGIWLGQTTPCCNHMTDKEALLLPVKHHSRVEILAYRPFYHHYQSDVPTYNFALKLRNNLSFTDNESVRVLLLVKSSLTS